MREAIPVTYIVAGRPDLCPGNRALAQKIKAAGDEVLALKSKSDDNRTKQVKLRGVYERIRNELLQDGYSFKVKENEEWRDMAAKNVSEKIRKSFNEKHFRPNRRGNDL